MYYLNLIFKCFYFFPSFICIQKGQNKYASVSYLYILGIITDNPPVVWAKITLPTRGLKSVT